MNLPKIFQKQADERDVKNDIDPSLMPEPNDVEGYVRRGWMFHSRGIQDRAQSDFEKALALQPDSVDATYVLGLVFKAQDQRQEAILAFQRVVELLDQGVLEDKTRATMLRRLALGHISEITTGDWNLEKQIWRRRS